MVNDPQMEAQRTPQRSVRRSDADRARRRTLADAANGSHLLSPLLPAVSVGEPARGVPVQQKNTQSQEATAPAAGNDVDGLMSLIEAGSFWRLAPEWVPRTGYSKATPQILRAVEAGLMRMIA